MKRLLVAGACAIAVGVAGCAADATVDTTGTAGGELRTQFGADEAIRCTAQRTTLAVVPTKDGKGALLSLKPAADVYTLSRSIGSITTSTTGLTWKGSRTTLTLGADMKGTWESGGQIDNVTCAKVAAAEAASWRTANALSDYAGEIEGIEDAVLEEMENGKSKPYAVFVVETARRGSLALGRVVANTAGSLSATSNADETTLDEDDFSYGAMSAAYSLGGGDDYGEWFQGASDGVSLIDDVSHALGSTAVAGFIAREKVAALSTLVGSQNPSAVEITVGPWTFFLPDAFAK